MLIKSEAQAELEVRYAKNQTTTRIKQHFTDMGLDKVMEAMGLPMDFYMSFLVQLALHKRANMATMVGVLRHHVNDTKMTAKLVEVGIGLGLCKWDEMSEMLVVKHDIPPHVQREIDTYQYPLPMIVEPEHLVNNRMTGYQTIKGSLILKDNYHDDDICLDHLNRVNQTALAINYTVVRHIQNKWNGIGPYQEGEDVDKYRKRMKAFNKYDVCSREVIDFIAAASEEIYLTHRYDKRGRTYAQGYHVNYQGNDWNKACVQFPESEGEIVQ